MSLDDQKEKSPYHGIGIACFFMIIVPILFYILMRYVIVKYQMRFSLELNLAAARIAGCGLGGMFHLACVIAGLLKEPFKITTSRMCEFFQNLSLSVKFAFSCYFEDLKENGCVFLLFISIIAVNLGFLVGGLIDFFAIYY